MHCAIRNKECLVFTLANSSAVCILKKLDYNCISKMFTIINNLLNDTSIIATFCRHIHTYYGLR